VNSIKSLVPEIVGNSNSKSKEYCERINNSSSELTFLTINESTVLEKVGFVMKTSQE
jgi:predicted N-acyltransferase